MVTLILMSVFSMGEFSRMPEEEKLELVGERVEVRGFAYQGERGWLLSDEPNLKSCCVGAAAKAGSQLMLPGSFEGGQNALVALEGRLETVVDEQGMRRFALEEARTIRRQASALAFGLLALLVIGVGYVVWKRFTRAS